MPCLPSAARTRAWSCCTIRSRVPLPINAQFVIARLEIDFLGEMHWPGNVVIGSRCDHVGRSSLLMTQALFVDGRCAANARSTVVLMDRATRRAAPLPPETAVALRGFCAPAERQWGAALALAGARGVVRHGNCDRHRRTPRTFMPSYGLAADLDGALPRILSKPTAHLKHKTINDNRTWRLVATVLLPFAAGYYLSYVFRTINALISGPLVSEFGLSAADLGVLTAVLFLTFGAVQLPLGAWLDRFGPRRVQAVLLSIAAIGAAVFACAPNLLSA